MAEQKQQPLVAVITVSVKNRHEYSGPGTYGSVTIELPQGISGMDMNAAMSDLRNLLWSAGKSTFVLTWEHEQRVRQAAEQAAETAEMDAEAADVHRA